MSAFIVASIAIFFYVISFLLQLIKSRGIFNFTVSSVAIKATAIMALVAHFLTVYQLIFLPSGLDFGFFKIGSLICSFVVAILLASSFKKPVENLFLMLFPLVVIVMTLSLIVPSHYEITHSLSKGRAMHVLLSILAYSVLTIAAGQATLLLVQNHYLKTKNIALLGSTLPPLQVMESLLFDLIISGWFLLTLSVLTGIFFLHDIFAQHLVHKTVLSILAWLVFGVLLFGRYGYGWRGRVAIRWTMSGFFILMLAYFGSKFVLELILKGG